MAYSAITALPAAPSRLGDPSNFVSESLAFLSAQAGFVSQCNAASSYFNAAKFDPFNWGDLSAITGSSPVSITNFIDPAPVVASLNGLQLAGAIDGLLASMVDFVPDANTVGAWADSLADPAAPSVTDPARPTFSSVSATPLRNDGQLSFGAKASAFYGSASTFSRSLQGFADYVATFSSGFEDWSSIAVTFTDSDDWGFIT